MLLCLNETEPKTVKCTTGLSTHAVGVHRGSVCLSTPAGAWPTKNTGFSAAATL